MMQSFAGPALARAGSGVCYAYFEQCGAAAYGGRNAAGGWKAVVEFAPGEREEGWTCGPRQGRIWRSCGGSSRCSIRKCY